MGVINLPIKMAKTKKQKKTAKKEPTIPLEFAVKLVAALQQGRKLPLPSHGPLPPFPSNHMDRYPFLLFPSNYPSTLISLMFLPVMHLPSKAQASLKCSASSIIKIYLKKCLKGTNKF